MRAALLGSMLMFIGISRIRLETMWKSMVYNESLVITRRKALQIYPSAIVIFDVSMLQAHVK